MDVGAPQSLAPLYPRTRKTPRDRSRDRRPLLLYWWKDLRPTARCLLRRHERRAFHGQAPACDDLAHALKRAALGSALLPVFDGSRLPGEALPHRSVWTTGSGAGEKDYEGVVEQGAGVRVAGCWLL